MNPDPDNPCPPDDEWSELADIAAVTEQEYLRTQRFDPRLRRAVRALIELDAPVPGDWVRLDDEGNASFCELPAAAFDRLVCLLEDLAEGRPVTVTVMRGGPSLFDPGTPSGPTATPPVSSVHLAVPH